MANVTTRRIAVFTTGRQDWGILRSTCMALRSRPGIELDVVIGGMHLSERYGSTRSVVEEDGFIAADTMDLLGDGSVDVPVVDQAGAAVRLAGVYLRRARPDVVVLVGDRYETAAIALAATLERVPIVHLHGGEETRGAFDDALRHAITKLAHLHLVSSETHRLRVLATGESPEAVHVIGAPGTDNLYRAGLPDRALLEQDLGVPLEPPVVIVAVHPVTLATDPAADARAVAVAMDQVPATYIVTLPNSDPGAEDVRAALRAASDGMDRRMTVEALGDRRFWGLLRIADAIVGNSSSALIEAPAAGVPAVDVGERQSGREHGPGVVHVPGDGHRIAAALRSVLEGGRSTQLGTSGTGPGAVDGRAGERAADAICAWQPDRPPRKAPIDVAS